MDQIDSVQIGWLWKALSCVSALAAALIGALWKRLESRVNKLESESAKHEDIVSVHDALRDLSSKVDRFSERAEERGQRLMETLISTFQRQQ